MLKSINTSEARKNGWNFHINGLMQKRHNFMSRKNIIAMCFSRYALWSYTLQAWCHVVPGKEELINVALIVHVLTNCVMLSDTDGNQEVWRRRKNRSPGNLSCTDFTKTLDFMRWLGLKGKRIKQINIHSCILTQQKYEIKKVNNWTHKSVHQLHKKLQYLDSISTEICSQ